MSLIKSPVITEKSVLAYKNDNKVTFVVDLSADKINASKSLETLYGVTVEGAHVVNRLGKTKSDRRTRKTVQKTRNKKIMVFKLKKGDAIDIFDQ